MKNILSVLALLFMSQGALSQSLSCPKDEIIEDLLEYGDLFLGEFHGTQEIPYFVQCLVERAVETSNEEIFVSLEMESTARNPASSFWSLDEKTQHIEKDGRSSEAMFQLVKYLVEMETLGKLSLHFHHPKRAKTIGSELKALSQNGLVIALAGNAHSTKTLVLGYLESEGMFVGENFTHINIASVNGGESWSCPGFCGINPIYAQGDERIKPGDLIKDTETGHDYIYFLEIDGFTASLPMDNLVYR